MRPSPGRRPHKIFSAISGLSAIFAFQAGVEPTPAEPVHHNRTQPLGASAVHAKPAPHPSSIASRMLNRAGYRGREPTGPSSNISLTETVRLIKLLGKTMRWSALTVSGQPESALALPFQSALPCGPVGNSAAPAVHPGLTETRAIRAIDKRVERCTGCH